MSYKILGRSTTCYPLQTNQRKAVEKITDLERTTYNNGAENSKDGAVVDARGGFTSLAKQCKHEEIA